MTLGAPEGSAAPAVVAPPGHIPGLDGARALATLSVFAFHALWRTPALGPLRPLLDHADIGVGEASRRCVEAPARRWLTR